ncbi:MAG: hypothetical protein ABSE73_14105, partial [Planctomycetota bacterium]
DSCSNSAALKIADAPERPFGNDCVYNCWHWVRAGQYALPPGKVPAVIIEREPGIALDQLLFTRDPKYLPVGPVSRQGEAAGTRRFADDFARSPGHGLEEWELLGGNWHINFSFDPNRIPNQYTLVGTGSAGVPPALALVKGPPWYGCKLAFSFFPQQEGKYGAVLDRSQDGGEALYLGFSLTGGQARLEAEGPDVHGAVDLQGVVRQNQWHRVVVERWAWVTRVWVDGRMVLANYSCLPRAGSAGLFVASGSAVFDDVELEEIHWQADDGRSLSLPWAASSDAKWFRAADTRALVGRSGSLSASLGGMALEEAVFEEPAGQNGFLSLHAPGLEETPDPPAALLRTAGSPPGSAGVPPASGSEKVFVRRRPDSASCGAGVSPAQPPAGGTPAVQPPAGETPAVQAPAGGTPALPGATLLAGGVEARVRRIAFRYGERVQKTYTFGPYSFAQAEIPDPADYLDFTPEEQREITQSPESQKFVRRQKSIPMIGDVSGEMSPWLCERGSWHISEGVLRAHGPDAVLRHAYELTGDLEFHCRLRFREPATAAEIELYSGPEWSGGRDARTTTAGGRDARGTACLRVAVATAQAAVVVPPGAALVLSHPGDDQWHNLLVRVTGNTLAAALDKAPLQESRIARGDGGRIFLKVPRGRADFDALEITTPRYTPAGCLYTFHEQEPDWWREGQWVDHGGNACVLASAWISLLAKQGSGMLWSKRTFGPDVLVAFDVEESSEWFGWDKEPSHVHHPFDNIRVVLAPADAGTGGSESLRAATVRERSQEPLAHARGSDLRDIDRGYRLEINAENRSATILYRLGKEVVRVAQNGEFPIHYQGGHAPYYPRRNHITLVKHGAVLRAIINGKEVLRFTDPQPLEAVTAGIGGHETRINFAHVEVRQAQGGGP